MGYAWTTKLTKARTAILGLGIAWAILSCSKDPGKRSEPHREFSNNPIINRLLEKSRATVQKARRLHRDELTDSKYPKYVETKNSACIVWFPTAIDVDAIVLDDRMTYVTCLGLKEAITNPMEYNEYRE